MAETKFGVQRAQFSEFNFERTHNPLHVAIQQRDKSTYLPNIKEESFVIALGISSDAFLLGPGPLPCVYVVTLDPPSPNNKQLEPHASECVTLLCSREFLKHYGIASNCPVFIQVFTPPLLSKVTFEASSVDAFEWANSAFFNTGLLLSICGQNKVLACSGKPFLAPYNSHMFRNESTFDLTVLSQLKVVETEPFSQGLLGLKTEFIVLNRSLEKETKNKSDVKSKKKTHPLPVFVSDFAVPRTSVLVQRHVNVPVFEFDKSKTCILQRDWNTLPCKSIHQLPKDNSASCGADLDFSVYVSLDTAKKYGLFNDSLIDFKIDSCSNVVGISISESNSGDNNGKIQSCVSRARVTSVKVLPYKRHSSGLTTNEVINEDYVYLTRSLWYNLANDESITPENHSCNFRKYSPDKEYLSSCSSSVSDSVPHAREAYIRCIYSPQYSTGAQYSQALKDYFTTPRLLQIGDVFAVDTKVDVEFSQQTEGGSTSQPVVYFRVKKLTPRLPVNARQTYRLDVDHTALYQESPCHSYVPAALQWPDYQPPGLEDDIQNISKLLKPYLTKWKTSTESGPSILLTGPAGCGKSAITKAVAVSCNMHLYKVNCHELCGETSSATETRILQCLQKACLYAPCVLHLTNVHTLGKDRDGHSEDARVASYFHECLQKVPRQDSAKWPVVVIATTSHAKQLSTDIHAGFLHTFEVQVPDEGKRLKILHSLLSGLPCGSSVSVVRIAQRTAGFVIGDLEALVCQARKVAYKEALKASSTGSPMSSLEEQSVLRICGLVLQQKYFDDALDLMQAAHSDSIGAPKIPNVTWDDVGGLQKVKADILDTIQLPLQHPELFAAGLRRSGVLLFGPPGTGKTLLAKAVATECSLNFLSVKGPELINMYVGQSEENIREVFSRARSATPCVIFFDELDSLAPNRGRSGDSGGVMDRVVSQLLAELDGLHKSCDVFVIGATNRPDLLDPALLRPGRFDKLLYLGVSEDRISQLNILTALTRKFALHADCQLKNVVEKCFLNMTGADFYALCSDAMLNALKRKIDLLDSGACTEEEKVEVCEGDFYEALNVLVPSVSENELRQYKQLQQSLAVNKA